jgi:hypothetical protein
MSSESAILQLLGSIPANAITLPKLVEQLQTRNLVIPFVGAGMSVPFGYRWPAPAASTARALRVQRDHRAPGRLSPDTLAIRFVLDRNRAPKQAL